MAPITLERSKMLIRRSIKREDNWATCDVGLVVVCCIVFTIASGLIVHCILRAPEPTADWPSKFACLSYAPHSPCNIQQGRQTYMDLGDMSGKEDDTWPWTLLWGLIWHVLGP
ncbi:hypothetical protein BKA64DRAFT_700053 [Cadophora sp. MPI-SDFR-AT-0126]|nr:hypothetical protein BKA64DRAFT_700053 [Leotiomycetes sp. MPI-SDFR-AT-0126]